MKEYNPFVTAMSKDGPSVPLRSMIKMGIIETGMKVLDYGAGRLRDSNFLSRFGCNVTAYDKFHPLEAYRDENLLAYMYDVVIANYVFNVIQKKDDLTKAIEEYRAIESIRKFVTIRADFSSVKPNWKYNEKEDCYYTGRSHQRFIDPSDFEKIFGKNKLIGKTSSYYMLELL